MIHIAELDKAKIIDAKYEDGVAAFLIFDSGSYNRFVITFNSSLCQTIAPVTFLLFLESILKFVCCKPAKKK